MSMINDFFEQDLSKKIKNKKLKFSSANLLSSIPLELLTNQAVLNNMFKLEDDIGELNS